MNDGVHPNKHIAWLALLLSALGVGLILAALATAVYVQSRPVYTSTPPPTPSPGKMPGVGEVLAPPLPTGTTHPLLLPLSAPYTDTPTVTVSPSASPTQTIVPTFTASPSVSPTPTATSTLTPRPTQAATLPVLTAITATLPRTHTPSPTRTHTPAPTRTHTPSPIATLTPSPSASPPPHPPTRIKIPAIALDAPIVPVSWETLTRDGVTYSRWQAPNRFAVGWHSTSAGVGQVGNLVLNGHHNVYGAVFARLIDVRPGDALMISSGTYTRAYVVVQTMVLLERGQTLALRMANARWVLPSSDERVTLVTCWPADDNSHRLIVVARPADLTHPFQSEGN